MTIQTDIGTGANRMCAADKSDVVDDLRRRHSAEGARRVNKRQRNIHRRICEGVRNNIWKRRIRFSLREQEYEARNAQCQYIDHTGTEHAPVAKRKIACGPIDFTQRRKAWKDLRPGVQRVAFQLL